MKRFLSTAMAAAIGVSATGAVLAQPLARANIVLQSAKAVDLAANTVTLPLHRGTAKGAPVWYIVTDTSDAAAAAKFGLLFSPLIASAGSAIEPVGGTIDALKFSGTVSFAPTRVFQADASGTPTQVKPGSIGDADYSPLVRIGETGPVYNAPIVASGPAPHDTTTHTDTLDRVVAINTSDAQHATVTLALARGFTNGQPIAYISTDASVDAPAAIERSTYAPRLKKLTAGAIPIDVFFNGAKQGISYAARVGHLNADATAKNAATLGSPLNVQSTFPAADNGASAYSPMWNVYAAIWTKAAVAAGKERILRSDAMVADAATNGLITAPDGKPFGAAGIVVNCPVVAYAKTRP